MIELIKRNYWWPGIKNNVKKYIQEYFKCQQNKVQYIKKVGVKGRIRKERLGYAGEDLEKDVSSHINY